MSLARLAWAYLASRPLLTALHAVLLGLGVATIAFLLLVGAQAEERLQRDARPVDLVVGAKGSPLQLILSAVFHADVPTGNIPLADAQAIGRHPMVASATPLALGDSFRGFRIVGTDASFLALYPARFARGALFAGEMEAVLGAEVARRSGLDVGMKFAGTHGLAAAAGGGPGGHEQHPYTVTGVLAPTGGVLDRLVLTSVESVWHVHEEHGGGSDEITALLLRFRTPLAAAMLPRQVNATTALQAASPAVEAARLMNLLGVGAETLAAFAAILIAAAALSLFIALSSALQERRHDLALLRALGARPADLSALVVAEGVTLVVGGVILGLALGHGAVEAVGVRLARDNQWPVTGFAWAAGEAWLVAGVLAAGLATCLLPAIQAYRRDPAPMLLRR